MTRIALIGAGLIGREHITLINDHPGTQLVGLSDPSPEAQALAQTLGVPHFTDAEPMLDAVKPDGVIIASPNALHVPAALACIARGIASLVEKPVADNLSAALRLVDEAERTGVPVLVGHQRRHSPDIRAAKATIEKGELGPLVAVNGMTLFDKPHDYFVPWRRKEGAGVLLINLIHDIDVLRHLVGEIESIRAFTSSAIRGFEVADTASLSIRFENGVLGSFTVSDAAVSPWAWEYSSGQALYHPSQPGPCLFLAGRKGALSVSDMYLWRHANEGEHWQHPLVREHRPGTRTLTYVNQLDHFIAVIKREAKPLISARDGMTTLAATLAVVQAGKEDRTVRVADLIAEAKT